MEMERCRSLHVVTARNWRRVMPSAAMVRLAAARALQK
jgi:hypothetical protein